MLTIDFETYYTKDYSLKKLTTEQYIRNPLFDTLGVGVKQDDQPTVWYAGGTGTLRGALANINFNQPVLAHNAYFDAAILSWVFGITPRFILDTLSMARPKHAHDIGVSLDALAEYYNLGRKTHIDFEGVHPATVSPEKSDEIGEYCCNDVDLTYPLFNILRREFPYIELAVINSIVRKYSEPIIRLDKDYLEEFVQGKQVEKDKMIVRLAKLLNKDEYSFNEKELSSSAKFSLLLRELKVAVPSKPSPSDPHKYIPALAKTDQGFKDLLTHYDPAVRALVEARLGIKSVLDKTRSIALSAVADRGALPIMLNYYGAHTGRFSGGEKLNLQNLPRNGKLRKAILAPSGHILIAADSSQIEARLTAWLAGQEDLLGAFRNYDHDKNNPSPYELMASVIYGRTITANDALERFVGKTCVLGLGYGMGAVKLRTALLVGQGGISATLTEAECENIVGIYRTTNYNIRKLWRGGEHAIAAIYNNDSYALGNILPVTGSGIKLPNGMPLTYAGLERSNDNQWAYCNTSKIVPTVMRNKLLGKPYDYLMTRIYGPKVIENVVQALARIVITEQMLLIERRYTVALQIHDENVVVVPEQEADEAKEFIRNIMSTPPTWAPNLPINCSVGVGKSYGEC